MGTIDLNKLSLFVAVAEVESFSAAAERLGLPKSSVSRGIASLEEELGVRLLHRTTRHVSASTAGAALYERVKPLLSALKVAAELPESEEEPSGVLRVTTTADLGTHLLAEVTARFCARHPAVDVDMRLTNTVVDMVAEGFDAAVRISTRPLGDSSLSARKIGPIDMQLYASPAYLARRGTPRAPKDLGDHAWVGFRPAPVLKLQGPGESVSLRPKGRVNGDDMAFVRESVRGGVGMGALPIFLAAADVAAGTLVAVLPRWAFRTGSAWFVVPAARQLPRKVEAYRTMVVEALKPRLVPAVGT